ncbi:MAG: ribosome silencing factor [Chloroflexi bacterium]|nr:ribosome silencing factor [Chloroflexota bacterium]
MAIKKLLDVVLTSLDNGKAADVDIFDVKKITSMSDYILIASGNSRRQVNALADKLIQNVKENKFETLGVEGKAEGEWVLVDLGDIIVHIMHPSSREYYQLEKLWRNSH